MVRWRTSMAAVTTSATPLLPVPDRPATGRRAWALAGGAAAMVMVGGSTAVSGVLADAPLFTAQAVRYALACVLLLGFVRVAGRRVVRPRGTEWAWLAGVTVAGLVVFNIALVLGAEHAEPAVFGVAVASVPLVLVLLGPLLDGHRPGVSVWVAAGVVTVGAGLVQGLGESDGVGLLLAVLVLACEAGFTLFAVPVLGRLGAWSVSVHTTWLAVVAFAVLGVVIEGPGAVWALTAGDWVAVGYLAVGVTALAFVLWYSCVGRVGAGRAGLLTGVAPVAAAATGVLLGRPLPGPLVWLGIGVVVAGLVLGLRSARP